MSEFDQVFEALKAQGWKLTHVGTTNKAVPPDPKRRIVHFSSHITDPHAIKNTLSQLRKSGFEWPPPRAAVKQTEPTEAPAAGPFAPTAQPDADETPSERLERLCGELKEAWGYRELAAEHLAECGRQVEAAMHAFTGAKAEHASAVQRVDAVKSQLDAVIA